MGALTAFPADGYGARWQDWDGTAGQTVGLRWENEGWTATGEVSRERVTYVIRLSATWQVRQFLLFRDLPDPDLWLATDADGRWGEMNGARRTELDGCTDLHLACTPFTATPPIRRLQLDVGEQADIDVVSVDVETLGVVPARQRYVHRAHRRWQRFEADGAVAVDFDVDEYGLVHDEPARFRRH